MILLDANFMIRASIPGSPELRRVQVWTETGETLVTSAVAWMEFANGPLTQADSSEMAVILQGRILSFGFREAALASFLFHQTGKRRASRLDCMIAATTIHVEAALATCDVQDFQVFEFAGLIILR